jgi:hypothetical protein
VVARKKPKKPPPYNSLVTAIPIEPEFILSHEG